MPYINKEQRVKYEHVYYAIKNLDIETKGDLEYLIFLLMQTYMKNREQRYSILHDVVYAAQHCADEFRRRFLDKREDVARETNGDVN
jgi:hypothetical protein